MKNCIPDFWMGAKHCLRNFWKENEKFTPIIKLGREARSKAAMTLKVAVPEMLHKAKLETTLQQDKNPSQLPTISQPRACLWWDRYAHCATNAVCSNSSNWAVTPTCSWKPDIRQFNNRHSPNIGLVRRITHTNKKLPWFHTFVLGHPARLCEAVW